MRLLLIVAFALCIALACSAPRAASQSSATLYLFSSGGAGHKQAMEAIAQRDSESPHALKVDLMLDLLGQVGQWGVDQWNAAQASGDAATQLALARKQALGNAVFGPLVFVKTWMLLKAHPAVTNIVNTQVMCLGAVCDAILATDRDVRMQLFLTDLPTPEAEHFWTSIRALSAAQLSVLTIFSPPVLDRAQPLLHLLTVTDDLPVRAEFFSNNHLPRAALQARGFLQFADRAVHTDRPRVAMLLLGSQCSVAALHYAHSFKQNPDTLLIVFCGSNVRILTQLAQLAPNVVALPNQPALAIAETMERADVVVLKTGGIASFEALVIDAQAAQPKTFLLHLQDDVPPWERGNASYLVRRLRRAACVDPQSVMHHL